MESGILTEDETFAVFEKRMMEAGLPSLFIRNFGGYYQQLRQGETGLISEGEIRPVSQLPYKGDLDSNYYSLGADQLEKTVMIKLNGGLGTSMGLRVAKSLLPVKDDLRFLDIIAKQASHAGMPVMLMNSFATEEKSVAALAAHNLNNAGLPFSFLQHKEPKIRQDNLQPALWPANPALEWCPPGHGDIYAALVTSGALKGLLEAGIEFAFVSNADNLGAVVDPQILGYFAAESLPFLMEVAVRTEMDRKGGHLALRQDGGFVLREGAQCPDEDEPAFQDIKRHKYFNTNNLWINLRALRRVLDQEHGSFILPLIRNLKTIDPRDPESTPVYQLETAMGSAITVFGDAKAIVVPRSRFAPVKRSNDLLAVRSDAYELTEDFHVIPDRARKHDELNVLLDERYYKFVSDLDLRFPEGAPSLFDCTQLVVEGDFRFGCDVVCHGSVRLVNKSNEPVFIPGGAILEG